MSVVDALGTMVHRARSEDLAFKAAGVTFYALASFVPLLVVALATLSTVGAADTLVDFLRQSLSESGVTVLETVLGATTGRNVVGGFGLLLALWGGTRVFRGLSVAFADLYGVDSERSFLERLGRSLVVVGALLLAFVALSATTTVLTDVDAAIPVPALVGNLAAVVVLVGLALPVYYVLPPVDVSLRHALPGAVLAAVGWVLLQVGFFYYARLASGSLTYGFLGAVLLFLTFLYVADVVLLAGAVVNAVVGERGVGA